MISKKSRHALRALLFLAAAEEGVPVQTSDICENDALPRKYTEQILQELKKPGLVRSHRGRSGGYLLGRSPESISFADVFKSMDGPLALSSCVSTTASTQCDHCFDETVCTIRKALLAARDATIAVLESRDLATAAKQLRYAGAL